MPDDFDLWGVVLSCELSACAKITNNPPTCRIDKHVALVCQKRMKGIFCCSSCGRCWDSTHCTVDFTYGYDYKKKRGIVSLQGYGQKCQRCSKKNQYVHPTFTKEGMELAAEYLKNKILEKLYGEINKCGLYEPQEDYVPRRNPHDSENCEACKKGKCRLGGTINHIQKKCFLQHPKELAVKSPIDWYLVDGQAEKPLVVAKVERTQKQHNAERRVQSNMLRNFGVEEISCDSNIVERRPKFVVTNWGDETCKACKEGVQKENKTKFRNDIVVNTTIVNRKHVPVAEAKTGRKNTNVQKHHLRAAENRGSNMLMIVTIIVVIIMMIIVKTLQETLWINNIRTQLCDIHVVWLRDEVLPACFQWCNIHIVWLCDEVFPACFKWCNIHFVWLLEVLYRCIKWFYTNIEWVGDEMLKEVGA